MFSTKVILLQLLLVSLASASHFYGSVVTFRAKQDSNGKYGVEIRNKATYRGCGYNYGPCYSGDCGLTRKMEAGLIDSSRNAPSSYGWCESETIITKTLTSNVPFQTREFSCCWISLSIGYTPSWSVLTSVDLGRRSDTNKPNNSPDVAILPFLRVPQNCRRTYKPISFDPDGDVVRCRYGTAQYSECYECRQHYGFQVDEATCTLQYLATGYQGVYGFEMVVEDFPRKNVNVYYSDGSSSFRSGVHARRKRAATTTWPTTTQTTIPWWTSTTQPPTTTTAYPTTSTIQTTIPWWTSTTQPPTTTTAYPTTSTIQTTTPQWTTTTQPPTTTTAYPTTSTTQTTIPWWVQTTTTQPPTTTTTANPTTSTTQTTTPWWTTTTQPPTTTTAYPTTTSAAPTTSTSTTVPQTLPWWWFTTTQTTVPWWMQTTTTTMTTTAPPIQGTHFSLLPLQFTFQVDPPAPSCTEGDYLPRFVPPTPRNGAIFLAQAGKEVEIKVKAEARYSTLDNIIMSGPLNITKHRTTGDEFVIRWTPIDENNGNYFPVCFAVEFTYGSAIYQTEMRCVVVNVTTGVVHTIVTCQESSMIVEVERATLPRIHEQHLRLSDPSNTVCSLQTHSNSTHIVAVVPLNACGTQIEEDADDLLFKNEIITVDDVTSAITRRHLLEIKFFCQYAKRGNVTLSFSAHRDKVTVWDKGLGQFTYGFEFYPDQQFITMIDPRLYPLEYDVGDRIYMEIEATTTVSNTQLFVQSCSASPYDIPNYQTTYSLIENGCIIDSTLTVHPSTNAREFKFSIEAFKFIGLHDQVYISCSVLMCEAGNPHTRCSMGCMRPGRDKREAVTESGTHYVSQGPLRLRRSVEAAGNTGLNLNLNLVFITGCVLAAVGMICAVIFYKTRKSSVKYQPLPLVES